MLLVVLNASKRFEDRPEVLARVATAISFQLRNHVAPAWGGLPWGCQFLTDSKAAPPGAYRLWMLDHPDQANALGYHDVDPDGEPYAKVFVEPIVDNGGTDEQGANSVSVTASHEAVEVYGDPRCGGWEDHPSGGLVARELCDPVEGDAYSVQVGSTCTSVSSFVFPAWFDRRVRVEAVGADGRYDMLAKLREPGTITAGGYMIRRDAGGAHAVFGREYPSWKHALKAHPAARPHRRASAGVL